jgi:hypothetical protein
MNRRRRALLFALSLGLGACAATVAVDKADKELLALQRQKAAEQQRHADVSPLQQQLGQQAKDALAAARQVTGDAAVQWYRIAAVASAEAGPAGGSTLFDSVSGGEQACEALPNKDASQPRDCGLIRLSLPVGVAEDLSSKLAALEAQRGSGQLPAGDLEQVTRLYDGFETQADKVEAVREGMTSAGVPAALKATADGYRRAIYCWAVKAYSLAFDVQGSTPASLAGLTARKTALRTRTEGALGPIHCDALPPPPALEG